MIDDSCDTLDKRRYELVKAEESKVLILDKISVLKESLTSCNNEITDKNKELKSISKELLPIKKELKNKKSILEDFDEKFEDKKNELNQEILCLSEKSENQKLLVEGLKVELSNIRKTIKTVDNEISYKGKELKRIEDNIAEKIVEQDQRLGEISFREKELKDTKEYLSKIIPRLAEIDPKQISKIDLSKI